MPEVPFKMIKATFSVPILFQQNLLCHSLLDELTSNLLFRIFDKAILLSESKKQRWQ